jgi:hypothetical protein
VHSQGQRRYPNANSGVDLNRNFDVEFEDGVQYIIR